MLLVLAVFLVTVPLCTGHAIPLVPGDNSNYIEGKSRFVWMPDGEGVPHLVDLQEPVDKELINSRNGLHNQYWLFTKKNPRNAQILIHGNTNSVSNSNYNPRNPLMVIVHGWLSNGESTLNPQITAQYLDVADANVIVVDWRALANGPYTNAVVGVPDIGRHLGNFLVWLLDLTNGDWNTVHLVGYSLGAHIVGNAGRTARSRPSRITGLDPAGPQWGGNPNALNSNDGRWVETIHTDGGTLGIFDPIADADFYPNGGRNRQPGCVINTCSHERAHELFAASVRHNHLVGRRCNSLQEAEAVQCAGAALNMGNSINNKQGIPGLYGLRTGSHWPF